MESIFFLGLGLPAWLTIATILTVFVVMLKTKLPADMVFMAGLGFLFVTGVLDAGQALGGFSSTSVVTVGVLFVVIAGMVRAGIIQWMVRYVLGTPKSYVSAIVRTMLSAGVLSSFLSNAAVVAVFTNMIKAWSKKMNIAPSKLLIPLSYASGLGGICTLIGTPPNLIISSFYTEQTGVALNVFITTLPGLFCLVVGMLSVIAMRRLLPVRKSPEDSFQETGEYTVELLVPTNNPHVGSTVADAGLMNVQGGHLIEVMRFDEEIISPVAPDEFIMGGDRLIYSGQVDEIMQLKKSHGLALANHHLFSIQEQDNKGRSLHTAMVQFHGGLDGRTVESTGLEAENNVVVVAVARKGERIQGSPRKIVLQGGDTLLLELSSKHSKQLEQAMQGKLQFFDSSESVNIGSKTVVSGLIVLGMMLLSCFGVMTLLQSAFLAAGAMFVTRCCTMQQARRAIDWNIVMVYAASVSFGTAIETTGIADAMAQMVAGLGSGNALVTLVAMAFVGTFLTELVSNTAAAAILAPVAYKIAIASGANPLTFLLCLAIAVSCSFATPIGSPTHMLVYGPGGYRFSDFMRIGLPMNIIVLIANIFIVTLLFPL